ncbi:DNRLRE domain-containing protein [Methanolobus psychrotolerans]|uniref:DNRLRE domain-containing protein n=1 Tax=Methanolobus psychrotolerans TaxID=1874706 RepID=UPI000B91AC70|nr:DNRLRE domain-containing protein [Methanolobus psychrotolerans]
MFLINIAAADEILINPIEDVYIDNNKANINFESSESLYSHSSTSITQYAYVTFYVPEFTESATLNMFVTGGYGSSTIALARISPDWEADKVTWNNGRPSVEQWQDYTVANAPYSIGQWVTWNVTSVVDEPGYYAFQTRSSHGQHHRFNSSESGVNIPYMKIETYASDADIGYNTKTNNDSYAFTVETNEEIIFSIKEDNVSSYTWSVNKVNQNIDLDSFTFRVPEGIDYQPSSQIWEIRVEGIYENSSTFVREWLISSLSENEAPDFIEYFIDRNNVWRTSYITDPWGRELAYYDRSENLVSKGFLSGTLTGTGNVLSTKFDITDGTFKYKIRNPGVKNIYYFQVFDTNGYSWRSEWQSNEFHDYFSILNEHGYVPASRRWLGQAPGVHNWYNSDWLDITIIKTNEGWWTVYVDDVMMPNVHANFEDALSSASKLSLAANSLLQLDCIEVYKDRYIYPPTKMEYGIYPKWWETGETTYGRLDPVDEVGIKISGKNVTLKQIADAIDNPDYITYDSNTRTAILKTNIALYDGSELIIDNEKLIIDTSDQSLSINPKVGVKLSITDSTITATNYPMIWNFASSISENVYDPDVSRNNDAKTSQPRTNHIYDFRGQFIVENSTIDNTGNLFLDAPYEVTIRNVIFSNHSSIDYGDYTLRGAYENHNQKKRQSYGEKGLWIVPRMDLVDYVVENVTFVEPKTDISLKVIGGEWIQNATTLKDSDLRGVDISAMKALKYEYYQNYWNKNEKSTLALLNTLYDEVKLSIDGHPRVGGTYQYDEAEIVTKYYLDIILKDSLDASISNSEVFFEPSNSKYPAESLYEHREYIADKYGPGEGGVSGYGTGYFDEDGNLVGNMHNITYSGGTYTRWYNALPLGAAVTDSNGQTSLPRSGDLENSIVLVDYVLTSDDAGNLNKESLTYTMNVETPSGQSVSLAGISPDPSWYRENPDVPTYTITAVIPENSTGPHITGFAPAEDNPHTLGEAKTFRVWTDEALVAMNWYVDGELVASNSMVYDWVPEAGDHSIVFQGSNAAGSVLQVWDMVNEAESPVPSGTGLSFTPSATSLTSSVGESTTFAVDSGQEFTSALWYLDDSLVESGVVNYVHDWDTASTHTVRFDGVAAAGTISRSWTVFVSEPEYSVITISPSSSVVAPGESFSLDVYIDPKQSLTGSQFDLQYSHLASVSSVNEGGLFSPDLFATTFEYGSIDNTFGILSHVYSAIVGSGSISESGIMATVNMVAGSSSGVLDLGLSGVILSDADSNPAEYTTSNATVLIDTAPQFSSIGAQSVEEEQRLSFTVSATDAEEDDLTYTATSLPSGASFDTGTATFTWTPAYGDAGSYEAIFEVTDGYLTDSVTVTVTVTPMNHIPVITLFEPADGSVFEEGSTINVNIAASDADGQSLSYIIKIDGSQVSTASSYTWDLGYESAGTHTIQAIVSDGIDEVTVSSTVTITDLQPRWDVNEDSIVNVLDITLVGQNYGMVYTGDLPRWDVNQDGVVNIQDLSIVAGHFGETV